MIKNKNVKNIVYLTKIYVLTNIEKKDVICKNNSHKHGWAHKKGHKCNSPHEIFCFFP